MIHSELQRKANLAFQLFFSKKKPRNAGIILVLQRQVELFLKSFLTKKELGLTNSMDCNEGDLSNIPLLFIFLGMPIL